MKKRSLYLGAISIAIVVVVGLVFFLGQVSDERETFSAIPRPAQGRPYIFMAGKSLNLRLEHADSLFARLGWDIPFREELASLSPFLSRGESAAFLVEKLGEDISVHAAVRFAPNDLQVLSEGEIPEKWNGSGQYELRELDEDLFLFSSSGSSETLIMKREGDLILFADSPEDIGIMGSVLEGNSERITPKFNKRYSSHVEINDAGILSQIISLYGINSKPGELVFRADWMENEGTGGMEWEIAGLSEIVPEEIYGKFRPKTWKEELVLPDPVLFTMGINMPSLSENDMAMLGMDKWQETAGLPPELTREIIKGPWALNISGQSKFLLFSFPGLLLQLLDRGDAGEELVELLWSLKWGTFSPSLERVDGYGKGGISSLPLSIVAVADQKLAIIGFMEKEMLKKKKTPSTIIPLMEGSEDSILWFFLDGPGLSRAFEDLISASALAEKMGSSIGEQTAVIRESSERLKRMGQISFIMSSLEKGCIRWENVEFVSSDQK